MHFGNSFYAQVRMLEQGKQKGRLYLFKKGLEVYGADPIKTARKEFQRVTDFLYSHQKNYSWVIALLGAKHEEPFVELFVYSGIHYIQEWPGNPSVDYAQFLSGRFEEKPHGLTSGDGLLVLGREEQHRRTMSSLENYLFTAPRFLDIKISL